MKLKIDSKIFEKFPDLNIGIMTAKRINNKGNNEKIINQIREKEKEIRANFNTETLSQNPKIDS